MHTTLGSCKTMKEHKLGVLGRIRVCRGLFHMSLPCPVRADTLVGPDEEWAAWVDFSLAWSSSQASMGWSGAGAGVDVGDSRGRDQAGSLDVPDLTR